MLIILYHQYKFVLDTQHRTALYSGTNLYQQYKKTIFKNISMQTYRSISIVYNVAYAGALVIAQLAIVKHLTRRAKSVP